MYSQIKEGNISSVPSTIIGTPYELKVFIASHVMPFSSIRMLMSAVWLHSRLHFQAHSDVHIQVWANANANPSSWWGFIASIVSCTGVSDNYWLHIDYLVHYVNRPLRIVQSFVYLSRSSITTFTCANVHVTPKWQRWLGNNSVQVTWN